MSRIIKFTPEIMAGLRRDFEEAILKNRLLGSSFSFSKTISGSSDRATLRFTELAWLKMHAIVGEIDKEVAWHGVAERLEDNVYLISDILVYPQRVTGGTVDMDVEEYSKWTMQGIMDGDERFDKLKAQGHSHVNMAVSPSPTDLDHQKEILNMLREDAFYIFMIWNKRDQHNCWIYDLAKNTAYDNADIDLEIEEAENGVVKFLRESKPMVKEEVRTAWQGNAQYGGAYRGGSGGYNGYGAYDGGSHGASNIVTGGADTGKAKSPAQIVASAPSGGKQKVIATVNRSSFYDDEDDVRGPFYYSENYYGME